MSIICLNIFSVELILVTREGILTFGVCSFLFWLLGLKLAVLQLCRCTPVVPVKHWRVIFPSSSSSSSSSSSFFLNETCELMSGLFMSIFVVSFALVLIKGIFCLVCVLGMSRTLLGCAWLLYGPHAPLFQNVTMFLGNQPEMQIRIWS